MEPFLRESLGKDGLCPDCGYVRWDCRCLADALKRIAELEAEVERLRHLGGAPPGVSPSPHHCECYDYGASDEPLPRRGSKERDDG